MDTYPASRTSSYQNHLSGRLLLHYDPILLLVSMLSGVSLVSALRVIRLIVSSSILGGVITLIISASRRVSRLLVRSWWGNCPITSTWIDNKIMYSEFLLWFTVFLLFNFLIQWFYVCYFLLTGIIIFTHPLVGLLCLDKQEVHPCSAMPWIWFKI